MATHDEHSDDYGEERSPWSKPSVLLSGMFVLALLVAGIAFLILKGGSTPHHAHATTPGSGAPPATVTPSAPTRNSSTTACTLPAGDQTVPYNSPPAGTQWEQVGSMSAPQAPSTLGPQHTNGVWNTCFAHSPSGALLAAMNFWAEGTAASPKQVIDKLAVDVPPGGDRNDQPLDAGGPVQIAGYRYQSYSPQTVQLLIALQGPEGKVAAVATTMTWTGTDWRFRYPSSGTPAMELLADLSGYVQWNAF